MKKAYDRNNAKRLLPLLETILREITDRIAAIERGEARLEHAKGSSMKTRRLELQAELANHRRELRLARRELESLGCVNDENNPREVLIPGRDGDIEHGYRFAYGESGLRALTAE